MQPVDPGKPELSKAQRVLFISSESNDLPALLFPEGSVLTCWELNEEERQAIIMGRKLQLWVWTYGHALQPLALRVEGVDYPEVM